MEYPPTSIHYVPVLKSKLAEQWAWRMVPPHVTAVSNPVFQVMPKFSSPQEGARIPKTIDAVAREFVRDATNGWHQGDVFTVDTSFIAQSQFIQGTTESALHWIARNLHDKFVPAKPVVYLDDPMPVLVDIGRVSALCGQGTCLRLRSDRGHLDPAIVSGLLGRVLAGTGLGTADLDLLLDFRDLRRSEDVYLAIPVASSLLQWAHINGPWNRATLLAGSAPQTISDYPIGRCTPSERREAEFFTRVVNNSPAIVPEFGDYGIWNPSFQEPEGYGSVSNMRYTHGTYWRIYREGALREYTRFHDIACQVVRSPYWPAVGANYSAGDGEIYRCTNPNLGRYGGPTEWLKWGASHHFAHIVERLTTLGAP